MDTLLITFANNPVELLSTLQEEDDTISRLLSTRAREQHFFLQRESYTTAEELARLIPEFRNDLVLFHFSGHAGRDRLETGEGAAYGAGLAQLLSQCPRLQVVFLNGCSTQGMVSTMLGAGVPVVIATNAPVDDARAAFFSIKFYEALQRQETVRDAFNAAKGALELAFKGTTPTLYRSAGFSADDSESPAWGLFFESKNEPVLEWRLPLSGMEEDTALENFVPNRLLINSLAKALAGQNPKLRAMLETDNPFMPVSPSDIRNEVLLTLPAPLAEPVRKLLVPVADLNQGYDKLGEPRLRQLVETYGIGVELLAFILLAQVWEAYYANPESFKLTASQRATVASFFQLNPAARNLFDLVAYIKAVREILEDHEISYFIDELKDLQNLIAQDSQFMDAVQYLSGLRMQVVANTLDRGAVNWQCKMAEEHLAYIYGKLNFMARYRLATILGIDVQKYRHKPVPEFSHATRFLHDLLGIYDLQHVSLKRFMDNRSILMIDTQTQQYLNLSPFVVDKNAFEEKTDVCKLYFFSYYHRESDTYYFRHLQKPADPLLAVSAHAFSLLKDQFDAFAIQLLQKPMAAL